MNTNTSKTNIHGLMKWKNKANMLKGQHRLRSMILELHKRNREQKRRLQASFPIICIQATLQICWSNQLKIINLRDTPNLRGTQNLQWIRNLQTQSLQTDGDLLGARKQSFLLWTEF